MIWKQYEGLPAEFLTEHRELVLYDMFHQIKAWILFPPNCSCQDSCKCSEWRERIILALNTNLYNEYLRIECSISPWAIKALWRIPEDHLFRGLHADAYPVWLIDKELEDREQDNHFTMIKQLVWIYLHLGGVTHSSSEALKVSQNKAMKLIFGETPLNSRTSKIKKDEFICGGEKEYLSNFNKYKFVSHFIVALESWKPPLSEWEWVLSSHYPSAWEIEDILKKAHWFRKNLLSLKRHNVKGNVFLSEKDLCPLPSWIHSDDIEFIGDRLQKVWD